VEQGRVRQRRLHRWRRSRDGASPGKASAIVDAAAHTYRVRLFPRGTGFGQQRCAQAYRRR
jgi:hypothetical protein